ncbi:MAG: S-adenosyl-l-methionine hydroxide adenosyltransferase family protein [Bacteroidota bacterium]|nr:S-adenosyl-l-methionine hydroxide adenosyltransferase family protein [Bacteroidota bacterium]
MLKDIKKLVCVLCLTHIFIACDEKKSAIVFQTDFGTKDGAVNAMKGVAHSIDADLQLFDLTHDIPAYDVWEAAYRLHQSASYWPSGTVFVSVVDPGVGTERKSIVMRSKSGHYFVTPDNGTLTLVSDALKIEAVRQIDEKTNRRNNSDSSYTFHGRDVYAYTAASLASGKISFEEVGPLLTTSLTLLEYQKPVIENNSIKGNIPVLDIQYGNVWSNIHDSFLKKLNILTAEKIDVKIFNKDSLVYQGVVPFVKTFGNLKEGETMAYVNSLMNFSLAINMGNFADSFNIRNGKDWNIHLKKNSIPK